MCEYTYEGQGYSQVFTFISLLQILVHPKDLSLGLILNIQQRYSFRKNTFLSTQIFCLHALLSCLMWTSTHLYDLDGSYSHSACLFCHLWQQFTAQHSTIWDLMFFWLWDTLMSWNIYTWDTGHSNVLGHIYVLNGPGTSNRLSQCAAYLDGHEQHCQNMEGVVQCILAPKIFNTN